MNKMLYNKLTAALVLLVLTSCALEPLDDNRQQELYTRAFIKTFGLIDPEQNWNMAQSETVTLNFGDQTPSLAKVYTKTDGKYYLVARVTGVSGIVDVPVSVPDGTTEVMVDVDGSRYFGTIGQPVMCTGSSGSRNIYNPSGDGPKEWEDGDIKVKVSYSTTGNLYDLDAAATGAAGLLNSVRGVNNDIHYGHYTINGIDYTVFNTHNSSTDAFEPDNQPSSRYQYFNTQQILPIVSNSNEPGSIEYYSLNTGSWNDYESRRGILPENGEANAYRADEPTQKITRDAYIKLGESGKITVYPYFYNATYVHTFGIYLIDDNGDAVLKNGKPIKFPIFNDKQKGDIQIAPNLAGITEFKLFVNGEEVTNKTLVIEMGETKNLYDYIRVYNGDTWIQDYNTAKYSSKLGFHCYGDGSDCITFDREGNVTGVKVGTTAKFEVAAESYKDEDFHITVVAKPLSDDETFTLTFKDAIPEPVTLNEGDEVKYEIDKLTMTKNGTVTDNAWSQYSGYVKTTDWYGDKMEVSIVTEQGRHYLKIKGKQDNRGEAAQWPKVYLDRDGNGGFDDTKDEILQEIHVIVKGFGPEEDETFALTFKDAIPDLITLNEGEEVKYEIDKLSKTKDGTVTDDVWNDYSRFVKTTSWYGDYMELSIVTENNRNYLKIKGKQDNRGEAAQWPKVYLDRDGNSSYDDTKDDILKDMHVVVKGFGPEEDDVFALTHAIPSTITVRTNENNMQYRETYDITKLTLNGGSDDVWDTYKSFIYVHNESSKFNASIDGNSKRITIEGVADNTADGTQKFQIYIDKSINGEKLPASSALLDEFTVVVMGPQQHTYTHTYVLDSHEWNAQNMGGKTWAEYFIQREASMKTAFDGTPQAVSWGTTFNVDNPLSLVPKGSQIYVTVTYESGASPIVAMNISDNGYVSMSNISSGVSTLAATLSNDVTNSTLMTFSGTDYNLTGVKVGIPAFDGGGIDAIKSDLETYYSSYNVGRQDCSNDECGHTGSNARLDFSGADFEVTIPNDAAADNIHFIVTWTKQETKTEAPARPNQQKAAKASAKDQQKAAKAGKQVNKKSSDWTNTQLSGKHNVTWPKATANSKRGHDRTPAPARASGRSRAAGDPIPQTLVYENTSGWREVNKIWDRTRPIDDEAASFITDDPVLARSRGYTIEIEDANSPTGKYTGNIGFYIDVYKNPACTYPDNYETGYDEWGSWNESWYSTAELESHSYGMDYMYTLYSQKEQNVYHDTANQYGGYDYEFSYACSFQHPSSQSTRWFYSFEDWQVAHPAKGDIPKGWTSSPSLLDDVTYTTRDHSSDRDFNDLIYALQLYQGTTVTNKDEDIPEPEESGYEWIWALEDLGTTDDFDFNDIVIKITSITIVDGDNESYQIVLTPMAAGGTMPIYIHFRYASGDYLLQPTGLLGQAYNLTAVNTNLPPTDDALEFHKWFGNKYDSFTMINTGVAHQSITDAMKCVIMVPTEFKLALGITDAVNNGFFYATVGTPNGETTNEAISTAYTIPQATKGVATQSFLVWCGDSADPSMKHWRWPLERASITAVYPHFREWVGDKNATFDAGDGTRKPWTYFYSAKGVY